MLSILHISDLHRDIENPLRNPILLDSLKRDRDRYTSEESPSIRPPDLIIVSGDLILGVKQDVSDADAVLRNQYNEASNFLTCLAEEFVNGDKERVIIVPGNHDVSDYHFRQSLDSIDLDAEGTARRGLVQNLFTPESPLRWSWSDFTLYRIERPEMYMQRFGPFVNFYDKFYEGRRSYSIEPDKQFDMFDFPEWNITIVGFCSCHNNDLLNRQGAIHPDCIARAGEGLRVPPNEGRLRLAVWHHNIEGSPMQVDYMDSDTVQNFIDGGFSLGFHGHQHKPQYLNTRFRYGSNRRITLISAGTLCGNAAYGSKRAYNIVELDAEAQSGCLHVREMKNDNLQMPIWGPSSIDPSVGGSLVFRFDAPPQHVGKSNHTTGLLTQAAEHYEKNNVREAAALLLPLARRDDLARPLLLDCLIELHDSPSIIAAFDPPQSAAEAIALMDALWDEGMRKRLSEVLGVPLIAESADRSVVAIRTKYLARLTT